MTMKTDYDEKQWRKAYDKAWLEIFDKLPVDKQELIKVSPSGDASATIGWDASIAADKANHQTITEDRAALALMLAKVKAKQEAHFQKHHKLVTPFDNEFWAITQAIDDLSAK